MQDELLEIKTSIGILKPVPEVFEAIADPEKMSGYFISKSTGRMEEGREVRWKFPEFDMEFPVQIGKIIRDQYISFHWDAEGIRTLVEINLVQGNGSTVVTITEKGMHNNDAGIKWLKGNTEGWANFLACLKAYLEYGINLRKGAYDFLSKNK